MFPLTDKFYPGFKNRVHFSMKWRKINLKPWAQHLSRFHSTIYFQKFFFKANCKNKGRQF